LGADGGRCADQTRLEKGARPFKPRIILSGTY